MAPHSSTLAWKIPWMEEPGRLWSMGSLRVRHDWATSLSLFTFMHWRRKWQPTPVFLAGESQGWGSLVGCCLWDRTELDTTEATLAAAATALIIKINVEWSRSVMSDSATPWTTAYQAPPSMGFSRQEYWSRVPLPSPNQTLQRCITVYLNWSLVSPTNLEHHDYFLFIETRNTSIDCITFPRPFVPQVL